MSTFSRLAGAAVCLGLAACTAAVPIHDEAQPSAVRIPPGPGKGFTVRQVVSAETDASWVLAREGGAPVVARRQSGLRMVIRFTVLEREGNSASIEAQVEDADLLLDGRFVPSPYAQFGVPRRFVYHVDFKAKAADFSPVDTAYAAFATKLRGITAARSLSAGFDDKAYSGQVGDLLRLPPLGYASRRYPSAQPLVEWVRFNLPSIAPSVSFGPFPVMQTSSLGRPEGKWGQPVAAIVSTLSSEELSLGREELEGRFAFLGATAPGIYESQGTLEGATRSVVSTETGWALQSESSFQSRLTANFEGGTLTEEIRGRRSIAPAPSPR